MTITVTIEGPRGSGKTILARGIIDALALLGTKREEIEFNDGVSPPERRTELFYSDEPVPSPKYIINIPPG